MRIFFLPISKTLSKDKDSPNSYFFGAIKKTEDGERIYYGNSLEWGKRYYYHDHLGSIRGLIDGQGNYLASYEYWPYGEEMTSSTYNEDSYRYTGHERDYDLKMDYMKSRHYKYTYGRFHQPDRVNGKTGIPLSFNLYSYALGNPLKFYDPTGRMFQYFSYGDEQYLTIGLGVILPVVHPEEETEEDKQAEEQADEANMPEEGDVILREDENSKAKDVARVDGRDSSGRLLIFGFDKETGMAKLVALGSKEDMFGDYKIIGIIDPEKDIPHPTKTWQESLKVFREKYEGKKKWDYTYQCSSLTTDLLFKKTTYYYYLKVLVNPDVSYYLDILRKKRR